MKWNKIYGQKLLNKTLLFYVYICIPILFFQCNDLETYSEIPKIEYTGNDVSYEYNGTNISKKNIKLHFSILDGNGDVGLNDSDTVAPYIDSLAYNFFSEIYVRKNNQWISGTELKFLASNYRMPYMGENYNTLLKASASIDFSYAARLFPYDSIKYEFYIVDRALNKSNVVTSDVIVLSGL